MNRFSMVEWNHWLKFTFLDGTNASLHKPIRKGSWWQRSSEGKPCEALSRNPKGFYSKLSRKTSHGKQHRGSWRCFVFSVCWLRRSIPKSAPVHFFFLKKTQTMIHIKSYLMFFLTTVTIQLPRLWIKNDQCINFCFHFKHAKGHDVQITHLFRQTTSLLHNKVHRGKGVSTLRTELCAQEGSACKTPALLCMVISSLF